jgi:hypothetical protein
MRFDSERCGWTLDAIPLKIGETCRGIPSAQTGLLATRYIVGPTG